MENENTPYPGVSDSFPERKVLNDKSDTMDLHTIGSTKHDANLFNTREAQIVAIVAEQFAVEAFKVTREATFDKLGADSLDVVELVMALEEQFDIEISDEEGDGCKTVADVFAIVETAVAHEADASIRPVSR